MRQIDAEITVSIGGRDSISADSVIVADSSSVPGGDRVLDNTIHTGVSVHSHHVFENGRADWRQLKKSRILFFIPARSIDTFEEKRYFNRDYSIEIKNTR